MKIIKSILKNVDIFLSENWRFGLVILFVVFLKWPTAFLAIGGLIVIGLMIFLDN